ncbi:MAG: LysM peptidoglycan-binding domain-containing protein [Anaerolineaceae bacterium]|nr:LysM peptidoglycan-binding domain-containing protein [Anaerolineaceae bacterium]
MQGKPLLVAFLAAVLLLLALPFPLGVVTAQSTPPSPSALITAINSLRSTNSLPVLQVDRALMAAAQGHSQYQASIGSSTHTGAGGTDETARALAAGYGSGTGVICDEAVAVAQVATSVEYVVNTIWKDYQHRGLVLLNSKYTDIGAGIAVGSDGLVYYTVNTCAGGGAQAAQTTGPGTTPAPAKTTEEVVVSATATPQENGSIIHVVETGQTLWLIANAYGLPVDQIISLNGLATPDPVIFAGQKLLVRPAFTPTLSPTITRTSRPATRTPRPTFTPQPTRPTSTRTTQPSATAEPLVTLPTFDRHWFGVGLVVICGLGLLSVLFSGLRPKRPGKKPPQEPGGQP